MQAAVPASPASATCRAEVPAHAPAHQDNQGRDWRVEAHRLLERCLCSKRSTRICNQNCRSVGVAAARNMPWCGGLLWQNMVGALELLLRLDRLPAGWLLT